MRQGLAPQTVDQLVSYLIRDAMTQASDGLAKEGLQPLQGAAAARLPAGVDGLAQALLRMTLAAVSIAVMIVMLWAVGVVMTGSEQRPFAAWSAWAFMPHTAVAAGAFFWLVKFKNPRPAWVLTIHLVVLTLATELVARQVVARGYDLLLPWMGWAWGLYGMLLANTLTAARLVWPHRARWWRAAGVLALVAVLVVLGVWSLAQAAPGQALQSAWALKFASLLIGCFAVYGACALWAEAWVQGQSALRVRRRLLSLLPGLAGAYVLSGFAIAFFLPGSFDLAQALIPILIVAAAALLMITALWLFEPSLERFERLVALRALLAALVCALALRWVGDAVAPSLYLLAMVLVLPQRPWLGLAVPAVLVLGSVGLGLGGLSIQAAWFFGLAALGLQVLLRQGLLQLDRAFTNPEVAQDHIREASSRAWPAAIVAALFSAVIGATLMLVDARQVANERAQDARALAQANAAEAAKELRHVAVASDTLAASIIRTAQLGSAVTDQNWLALAPNLVHFLEEGSRISWVRDDVLTFAHPLDGPGLAVGAPLASVPDLQALVASARSNRVVTWGFVQAPGAPYPVLVRAQALFLDDSRFSGLVLAWIDPQAFVRSLSLPLDEHLGRIEIGLSEGSLQTVWQSPGYAGAPTSWLYSEQSSLQRVRRYTSAGQSSPQAENALAFVLRVSLRQQQDSRLLIESSLVLITALVVGFLVLMLVRRTELEGRRKAQRTEREQLQRVMDQSLVGEVLFDSSGRWRWNNQRARQIGLGPNDEQLQSLTLSGLAHLQVDGRLDQVRELFARDGSLTFFYTGLGHVGQPLDASFTYSRLDVGGEFMLLMQILDLSELHAHEREVEAQKALADERRIQAEVAADLAQDLYDNAPCGYHSLDSQGRVLSMNRTELGWLKKTSEEVVGKPFVKLLALKSVETFQTAYRKVLSRASAENFELEMLASDGMVLTVSASASLARDRQERVLYVRMMVVDVSETKRNLLELALARDLAQEASQAKSQFLSIMSHEIRTPLNWVMGMLQVLSHRRDLPQSAKPQVDMAYQGSEVLLSVLNDVLDFSSLSAGRFALREMPGSVFDVMVALKSLVQTLPAGQDLQVVVDIDPRLVVKVNLDSMRLRQVLLNLLNNAIKFTERGSVMVSARLQQERGEYVIVEIVFQDTGIGMDDQTMAKLFTPFMQADMSDTRRFAGTGLGLAISRDLVRAMGGQIHVHSQVGVGSTFTVSLSLTKVTVQDGVAAASATAMARNGGREGFRATQALEARTRYLAEASAGMRENAAWPDGASTSEASDAHAPLAAPAQSAGADNDEAGVAATAEPKRPSREPVTGTSLEGLRVLVVDDQMANLQAAQMMLEAAGASVVNAFDGATALKIVHEPGAVIDVILMDLQMGGMDGLETTRQIRQDPDEAIGSIPILAMTGKLMDQEREKTAAVGMNGFLSKPVDMVFMVREILRVCTGQPRRGKPS